MIFHLYNILMTLAELILMGVSPFCGKGKFGKFVKGHCGLTGKIRREFAKKEGKKTAWIHAASLGEYAVARPIISKLKVSGYQIVVTFFSSTGLDALERKKGDADHVWYLPIDTRKNAANFLDIVKPDKAIFMISEFWPSFLSELDKRGIDTYLVSALIRDNSAFFKPLGKYFASTLKAFKKIMVLDEHSAENLRRLGYSGKVMTTGDPLFDNAILVANKEWHHPVIEKFATGKKIFVAGSIHDEADLRLVAGLANKYPEDRFIFVPHEINESFVAKIKESVNGKSVCVSEISEQNDFNGVQVLIVDFIGALASIYRLGSYAYVGGGFTPLLHSVIEATVYGLPVSFGPKIERKVTPNQLIELNIGRKVENFADIDNWYSELRGDNEKLDRIKAVARQYTEQNSNATEIIVKEIMQ